MSFFDKAFSWLGYEKRRPAQSEARHMWSDPPAIAKRSFSAAVNNRLTNDWSMATATSADRELYGDIRTMRWRSRDQERSSNHIRRYLKLGHNNILGANGIGLQMKVREMVRTNGKWGEQFDTRANGIIEDCWRKWGKRKYCCIDGLNSWRDVQRLSLRSALRDGSTLTRLHFPQDNPFHFELELMEIDHLDSTLNVGNGPNGSYIRLGVQYNARGRVEGFHILRNHPGDTLQPRNMYGAFREFIPADQIIHPFIADRIGQSDGAPQSISTILQLRMLEKFSEAEVTAARASASKMGFLESQPGQVAAQYTGAPDGKGGQYMEMEPGSIEQLPYGMKFTEFDPSHPNTAYSEFVKAQLREVAAGLGVSYHSLANDIESVNYSSIRAGLLEEREEWKVLQTWFIEWFIEPIFEKWLETTLAFGALTDGVLTLPASKFDKFNAPEWKPRRWPWVDPLKDVQAAVTAIQNRLTSHRSVISENGGDVEDTFSDIEADEQLAESKNIDLDATPQGQAALKQNVTPGEPVDATQGGGTNGQPD